MVDLVNNTIDNPGSITNLDKDLGQGVYDFTSRIFPEDIGAEAGSYNGHYMVININVSNQSNFSNGITRNGVAVNTSTVLPGELSKVDTLRGTIDKQYKSGTGKQLGVGDAFIPRQTRRIQESIVLFMPDTVVFSQSNEYEDISLTGIATAPIKAVLNAIPRAVGALTRGAVAGIGAAGQLAQLSINPRTEVIFSNTRLRQFHYDFLFAPVSENESKSLEQIIKTIRYHAAPENNALSLSDFSNAGSTISNLFSAAQNLAQGFLWTPPSEFDITLYKAGTENTAIPRINTCVLEQVDVDYAPRGIYSTFSNGYPVSVRMQLLFREVAVVDRVEDCPGVLGSFRGF